VVTSSSYVSKQDACHAPSFYDRSMREAIDSRLALENGLREAIARGQFRLQ